ncbi:MAG: DUF1206 domain-containing protein [Rhodanobacter sp.]
MSTFAPKHGGAGLSAKSAGDGRTPARWLRWAARCGFVAEGLVYVLIGGLALLVAFEPGQRPQGSKGALVQLGDAPLGRMMLAVLAAGLAAFVLWQCAQALFDPEHRHERWSPHRVVARLGCLLNAALHAVLVGYAAWHVLSAAGGPDHGRTQAQWTARVMQLPLGRWAVALTGVGIVAFGMFQFYRAATGVSDKDMDLSQTRLRFALLTLGVTGCVARGVVFALIGVFLVHAAWRYDATQATGVAGALSVLKAQPGGSWLLGAVASGLVAYGLFQIAKARFRVIHST